MYKIVLLDIDMSFGEVHDTIHPVVLCDKDNRVLVDCGYIGSLQKIEDALNSNDIAPESVTHIILTHQDHDHIGAAAKFKRKYPKVKIMASSIEAPYITGTKKTLRLEQAEQLQKILSPQQQAFGVAFCNMLRNVEPVGVDWMFDENDNLPFCGGCRVLHTPGHTPGHISLYLKEFDIIIAGDAIALENGIPVIANPQFSLDIEEATASMQRLLSYKAKTIICYHGGKM